MFPAHVGAGSAWPVCVQGGQCQASFPDGPAWIGGQAAASHSLNTTSWKVQPITAHVDSPDIKPSSQDPCPTIRPSACFDFGHTLGQRVAETLGLMAAGRAWSLDTHVLLSHHIAVPEKCAGWSCFSLGTNYIPPTSCAPTHAPCWERRERRK